MSFLIDTNVFITILKGDASVKQFVESNNCAIDSTVYIECLQGSKSHREKRIVARYLAQFPLHYQTPDTSIRAIKLIELYSSSHGLLLPDAQIAALCLVNAFSLLTFNTSDFRFIDGLRLPNLKKLIESEN